MNLETRVYATTQGCHDRDQPSQDRRHEHLGGYTAHAMEGTASPGDRDPVAALPGSSTEPRPVGSMGGQLYAE